MGTLLFFVAAAIPLLIGMIWYNPKVLGNAWMESAGLTEESAKGMNMFLIFGLVYVMSLMACLMLHGMVVHQDGLSSLIGGDPAKLTSDLKTHYDALEMATRDNFRTFKHGALHGTITSVFFVLPIIGINALFERRGAKYIFIHLGFWTISFALMGGILCQFC